MSVRKYFFGLQHIVPYDMEETLENMGRQGLELMNVGQTGLLFFD